MWLDVNPRSPIPMYQQIVDGVRMAIAKGTLLSGDRLPSVREFAVTRMINHNTIARAYQELERAGVIEVLRGRGTFVAQVPPVVGGGERRAEMRAQIVKLIVEAHHLQMSEEELRNLIEEELCRFQAERE